MDPEIAVFHTHSTKMRGVHSSLLTSNPVGIICNRKFSQMRLPVKSEAAKTQAVF